MTIKEMVKKAKQHYPTSKTMRRQWIEKTAYLYMSNRHASLNGGWKVQA